MDEINELEIFDELDAKCKELTGGRYNLLELIDIAGDYKLQWILHQPISAEEKFNYAWENRLISDKDEWVENYPELSF
jgi:hypothetical protein